jgi:hypothetical protein
MLRICEHPDCTTLTLGTHCLAHEAPVIEQRFPRGRPYTRRQRHVVVAEAPAVVEPAEPRQVGAVSLRGGSS